MFGRKVRRKPLLTSRHKAARLEYAKEHVNKPNEFWNMIMWSDETKVELFGHNLHRNVWQEKKTFL